MYYWLVELKKCENISGLDVTNTIILKSVQIYRYILLSKYRSKLMEIFMLWVMLFHACGFQFKIPMLDIIKEQSFGGVDIFILLTGMELYISLLKRKERVR